MTRLVDVIVGLSAMAGILTFLGVRTAVRRTLRTLGRKPEPSPPSVPMSASDREKIQAFVELNRHRLPVDEETREKARRLAGEDHAQDH